MLDHRVVVVCAWALTLLAPCTAREASAQPKPDLPPKPGHIMPRPPPPPIPQRPMPWPEPQVLYEIHEPREQCSVWLGKLYEKDSMTWGGACVKGIAQGLGTLFIQHSSSTWDRYDGALRDGRMAGQGVMVWATGARYEGSFLDGQFTGQAVMTWGKASRYVGPFRSGLPDGHGTLQLDDGSQYEGEFSLGMPNGEGTYLAADGTRYEGAWRYGCYSNGSRHMVLGSAFACPKM
jgi:hypothetical protein